MIIRRVFIIISPSGRAIRPGFYIPPAQIFGEGAMVFQKGGAMAEIKSTLDLVMERTRGLSLTDKEKKEIKSRELAGKIQALLERYSNDYMALKWLETELNNMGMAGNPKIREAVRLEILERLSPNGDSDKLFEALEGVLGIRPDAYRAVIAGHHKALAKKKEVFAKKHKARLDRLNISGSAVLPNLAADPGWKKEQEKMAGEFRQKIKAVS